MASVDSLQVKQLIAQNASEIVVDDTPVIIRLKYKGAGTVTSVTVDTDQDITLVTSDGGTEAFLFATYTTIGALADAINESVYWEALVLDALRADLTAASSFVDDATVAISSTGFYDCLADTSTAKDVDSNFAYTIRCTMDRNPDSQKPQSGHRVRLSEALYNVNVNAALAKGFRIYEYDAVTRVESIVYQKASVDATATTVNFASGNKTLDAGFGNDLIVRVVDGTSITDAAANFLNCSYTRE